MICTFANNHHHRCCRRRHHHHCHHPDYYTTVPVSPGDLVSCRGDFSPTFNLFPSLSSPAYFKTCSSLLLHAPPSLNMSDCYRMQIGDRLGVVCLLSSNPLHLYIPTRILLHCHRNFFFLLSPVPMSFLNFASKQLHFVVGKSAYFLRQILSFLAPKPTERGNGVCKAAKHKRLMISA